MSNKSRFPFGGSNRDDEDDEEEDKGKAPSSGSRPGSPFNRSGSSRPDDKKRDDKPGGFGSRTPFGRRDDDDDDNEEEEERDSRPAKPGAGRPSPFSASRPSPFGKSASNDDDEDEEENFEDDEDEEDERPARSSFGGNRPGSGGKGNEPGKSSPFGGSKSSEPAKPGGAFGGKPGGGSAFGGKSNEPSKPGGGSTFGGNKPNESGKSSPFGGSKSNEPAKPGGAFGAKPGGGSSFGNKPNEPAKQGGGSAFGGNKPNESGKSSPFGGSKSNEPAKPGGSSPFGGSKSNEPSKPSPFNASRPNEPAKPGGSSSSPFGSKPSSPFGNKAADKDRDRADEKPSGGGFKSPFGGKKDDKAADKKDDKPAGGLGGFKSPFGAKPGDKAADKKDDKPSGGLGGFKSPFGAKPSDKKDDKPVAQAGGLRSPFGAKPGDRPAEKKDDKPAGGLGGFRSPFGAKPGDKPAEKKDDKPAGGGLFGKLPFGAKSDDKKDDRSASKTGGRPDDARKPGPAIPARGGAVTTPPKSSSAGDAKKAGSKVPPARGEKAARPLDRDAKAVQFQVHSGLNLDQKLDLVGYALMFSGVLLLFSLLNPSEGSITQTLANLFGGLVGRWGTAAVMVTFFGIGLWLFIRHFTENPLVIKVERAVGFALMFVTLITTIHYIVLLSRPVASMADLFKVSDTVAKLNYNGGALGNGGGWLGGQIYKTLISAFGFSGDYILPVLLTGLWIASIYLALALTMAEVSSYIKSIFHWFGRVRGSYMEHRRAAAEARAAAAPLSIESPVAAGATPAAATLGGAGGKKGLPERTGAPRLAPAGVATAEKIEAAPAAAKSAPFGKPPAKPAETVEEVEEEEAIKPAEPAKAAPAPFGARPGTATTSAPVSTAVKPAEAKTAAAPAKAAPKPGLFGARPAKPADEVEEDMDEDLDELEVKPAAPIVKPSPLASTPASQAKPSPFGAKPGASVPVKPADKDKADDEADDLDEDEKAEPAKPATPVGNRPSPFGSPSGGSKPGSPFGAKPGGPTLAPAKSDDKDKEDELDEDEKAEPTKPATPAGSRPSPFGNPFGKKPADGDKPKGDDEEDELDEDEKAEPAKPATPIGNRPNPFGSPASGSKLGSPFANPFGKKPADDEEDELDEDEKAEPAKPATPIGNRPSPFGSPPTAAPRPAPKPGSLATRPPLDDEDEEEADEPKYVSVDELEDDGPPRGGPRPTVAGGVGTTPSAMPRPANPIAPKPRPGEEPGKPSAPAGGGAANSPFGQRPPSASAPTGTTNPATTESASAPKAAPTSPGNVTAKPDGAQQGQPNPAVTATQASAPTAVKAAEVKPADGKPAPAEPPLEGVIVRSKPPQHGNLPDFHELLESGSEQKINDEVLKERARVIEDTLKAFSAPGKVVEINPGPVITQFGVEPDYLVTRQGKKIRVKVSQIARLDADLALALAARSIRIEAPVPGKGYVGIEVPNAETALVGLRDIMDSEEFQNINSKLRIGLGKSVDGAPIAADLTQMPHLLIAGTTGSGKSVCVNALITCLLLENTPDDLKMVMVDPKRVELTGYNGIPHLVSPVVVDLERIVGVLKWVTREMEERYKKFSQAGARNISDFNGKLKPNEPRLPYLVVVIDELADLMMLAPEETERVLTRLAQMARATGIHLIISTQRPSVDVVTGLIKANFPARISFAVASSVDSRVVLDQPGAEKLLGRGDMLFQSPDAAAPLRMQGVFVSDAAINRVTTFWKGGARPASSTASALSSPVDFNRSAEPVQSRAERFAPSSPSTPAVTTFSAPGSAGTPANKPANGPANGDGASEDDEMYEEALDMVRKAGKPSISLLQRRLRIGYTRAARLIELMEKRGAISPAEARNASGDVADEGEDTDKPEKA